MAKLLKQYFDETTEEEVDEGIVDYPGPFYHATYAENVDSIRAEGFTKGKSQWVYFTTDIEQAKHFGDVVLKIELPENFMLYTGEYFDTDTKEVFAAENLPASWVKPGFAYHSEPQELDEEVILSSIDENQGQTNANIIESLFEERGIDIGSDKGFKTLMKKMDSMERRGKVKRRGNDLIWTKPQAGRLQ